MLSDTPLGGGLRRLDAVNLLMAAVRDALGRGRIVIRAAARATA